ncbi:spliced leader protein [Ditylenchus destructor]|uniref:Spliced leader protein n=1 Tax=Ditylenchus destructor TaxID=166010 RepID=A0AAD4N4L4_9BILA|nr:spliced leader protein [Ditylenchus destructor]
MEKCEELSQSSVVSNQPIVSDAIPEPVSDESGDESGDFESVPNGQPKHENREGTLNGVQDEQSAPNDGDGSAVSSPGEGLTAAEFAPVTDFSCENQTNGNRNTNNHDAVNIEREPDAVSDAGGSPQPVNAEQDTRAVVDEISIAEEMDRYMTVNRVNWAEVNGLIDMYAICDAISAAHSGLPDTLLKDAFLVVLESHHSKNFNNWVRQHLESLLRMWKTEVQSEKVTERETKFVAVGATYSPPIVKKSRRTKGGAKRKAALQRLMGVGEMLQQARVKFATEEGELEVEEDVHGNISIGGCELSFETWGQINKIKDADIVHTTYVPPKQKRPKMHPPSIEDMGETTTEQKPESKKAQKPQKPPKPEVEKDEGEITESESSTASSSSEDDETDLARHKRRKRRQKERQSAPTSISNLQAMFSKFYQVRFQIAHNLTLQQKAIFMEILKQSNGGMNAARQKQMMDFMGSYMGGSPLAPK